MQDLSAIQRTATAEKKIPPPSSARPLESTIPGVQIGQECSMRFARGGGRRLDLSFNC